MSERTLPPVDLLRQLLDYDPETGILTWKPRTVEMFENNDKRICATWNTRYAGKEALGNLTNCGYKRGAILSHNYLAHRVAWAIFYGKHPDKEIDHINGDRSDNRIANLRDVSKSENQRNATIRSDNASGFTGVCWHKDVNKWIASIFVQKKNIYLGIFENIEDAKAARKAAEREYGFHKNHGKRKGRHKPPQSKSL